MIMFFLENHDGVICEHEVHVDDKTGMALVRLIGQTNAESGWIQAGSVPHTQRKLMRALNLRSDIHESQRSAGNALLRLLAQASRQGIGIQWG